MTSSSFMIDSKREEFRKYLENSGIMDKFTEVLTELYESQHRPENALEFVLDKFSGNRPIISSNGSHTNSNTSSTSSTNSINNGNVSNGSKSNSDNDYKIKKNIKNDKTEILSYDQLADELRRAKESAISMKSKMEQLEKSMKKCTCHHQIVSSSTTDL